MQKPYKNSTLTQKYSVMSYFFLFFCSRWLFAGHLCFLKVDFLETLIQFIVINSN